MARLAYKFRRVYPQDDNDDARLLNALDKICGLGGGLAFEDGQRWWVALSPGGRLAVAYCGLAPSKQQLSAGYLCRAGVCPPHRGRGLQRAMIRLREKEARALGWARLVTDTTYNTVSANNLIACGYRLFDPKYPWAFRDTLYWTKEL